MSIGRILWITLGGVWSTLSCKVVETESLVMSSPLPGIPVIPVRKVLVSAEARVGAALNGTSTI